MTPMATVTAGINYAFDTEGRARFDVVDPSRNNVRFHPTQMTLRDARPINDELDLDVQGFKLVRHVSSIARTGSQQELEATYLDEMAEFIKNLVGAREARPQRSGMLVRDSKSGGWQQHVYPPARFAHLDYTDQTKDSFLKLSLEDDGPLPPYSRLAVYQAWRVISPPPQDTLLAVADPRTVPDEDTFVMDSVLGPEEFPSCFFESRLIRANPAHAWYYFSDMQPDEVLVFKGYDSDPKRAGDVMHTAFDLPPVPDAVPRHSVEARFLAFFD